MPHLSYALLYGPSYSWSDPAGLYETSEWVHFVFDRPTGWAQKNTGTHLNG